MVILFKNNTFWSLFLFVSVVLMSVSSKWFTFLELGVFNYSILLASSLIIPNIKSIFREISNSQIESIKLPFCELKFSKNFDYYFLGEREGDENNSDMIVLAYYKNVSNEEEAYHLLNEEYPDGEGVNVMEVVRQVHYK